MTPSTAYDDYKSRQIVINHTSISPTISRLLTTLSRPFRLSQASSGPPRRQLQLYRRIIDDGKHRRTQISRVPTQNSKPTTKQYEIPPGRPPSPAYVPAPSCPLPRPKPARRRRQWRRQRRRWQRRRWRRRSWSWKRFSTPSRPLELAPKPAHVGTGQLVRARPGAQKGWRS